MCKLIPISCLRFTDWLCSSSDAPAKEVDGRDVTSSEGADGMNAGKKQNEYHHPCFPPPPPHHHHHHPPHHPHHHHDHHHPNHYHPHRHHHAYHHHRHDHNTTNHDINAMVKGDSELAICYNESQGINQSSQSSSTIHLFKCFWIGTFN